MYENAASYLGQYNIGTNSSDKGQCVGLYNQVVLNVSGILYPIQGAQGAKDLLTAKNTRPDLFQQIFDKPGDPNWIPRKGDWVVWGSTWGGGWGHVACVKTADANSFTSVEQNFVPNKVTEQWHDYNGVIGWIRYTPPAPQPPADPCADVKAQLNAANQQINTLNSQVNTLNLQLTQKQTELDQANAQVKSLSDANTALQAQVSERDATIAQLNSQITNLNAEIAQLKKQLEHCGGITINFNFIGSILWFIIQKVGKK